MTDRAPPSRAAAAFGLIVLALVLASGSLAAAAFSAVQEAVKADLKLSDFQLSLLQGLAPSIPLALLSVPIGLIVDKRNRIRVLAAMGMVWTAGTLLTAVAHSLPVLFVARMLAGLGANAAVTVAISLGADLTQPTNRGRGMLVLTIGKQGGVGLGFGLGGALLGTYAIHGLFGLSAWRSVHVALGLGSAVAIVLLLFVREPARREQVAGTNAPIATIFHEVWARRAFLIPLFIGQVGVIMCDVAAAIWAAPVLGRSYGLTPQQFGGWLGAIIFGAGLFGAFLGGFAADWGHRRARRGGILIGAVLAAAFTVPAALYPIAPGTLSFGVALAVLLLGGTITGLVTATALAVLLPNEIRGMTIGGFIAVAGLIAFGISPSIVTGVSSLLGGEQHLGAALAIVGITVSAMALVGFALAMRHAPATITDEPV